MRIKFLVAALSSLIMQVSATAAENTDSELAPYLESSHVRDISMSPDGSKLAVIQKASGDIYSLLVFDIDKDYDLAYSRQDNAGGKFAAVQWATDDRLLVTKKRLIGSIYGNFYKSDLYSLHGDESVYLLSSRSMSDLFFIDVVSVVPNDPDHIIAMVAGKYPHLYKINIKTGKGKRIASGNRSTRWWGIDPGGNPMLRIDFLEKSRVVNIFARAKLGSKWKRARRFRLDDLRDNAAEFAGLDGEENVLILDRPDGDEFVGLYNYDVSARSLGEPIMQIDGYDLHGAIYDEFSGGIVGVTYIDDRLRSIFFNEQIQSAQEKLEAMFPNGMVSIQSYAENKDRALFRTSAPWNPGAYRLYDAREESVRTISAHQPELLMDVRTVVDVIKYRASDGTLLAGYLTFADDLEPTGLPMIVYPHGGPHSRDWLEFDLFAQYWATRGYLVFQPNFRGSTGYGKSFQEKGYREYGGMMIEDIASGIRAIVKAGYANDSRICAAGFSYGGYASLMLAANTDLLSCAVSVNGPTDWFDRIKNTMAGIDDDEKQYLQDWYEMVLGDTVDERELIETYSPAFRAHDISTPVLLMHAADDDNVSVEHSRKMNARLLAADKDVSYVEIDKGGHNLTNINSRKSVISSTTDFFARHIGGATLPDAEVELDESL